MGSVLGRGQRSERKRGYLKEKRGSRQGEEGGEWEDCDAGDSDG
jgi:hypothetical protein